MNRLRRLDDEFLSGALWERPGMRVAAFLVLGVFAGAVSGVVAWPLVSLGYEPSDYSVVAVPFITVPVGALVGLILTAALLLHRDRR